MRPLADIPTAFWEESEDLRAKLPLVERWLEQSPGTAPLAGTTMLLVQHQLANHVAQVDALIRLGADPERIHWMDIPYSSHAKLRAFVQTDLGIPARNFRNCDDYRALAPYAPYQLRRAVECVLTLAENHAGPLLVLDDGAYVLEALSVLRKDRWPNRIAVVEQTTRGIIKIEGSASVRSAARCVPLVDVARSVPKRTLEPPFIGMAICASLDRWIRSRYKDHRMRRCLVLGYGAIGEQVATFVDQHFGFGRRNVHVYDGNPDRAAKAARRGFPRWDREALDVRFDLVVGCSGRSSFAVGDYVYLEDGALLASASSGSVELSRAEFIELADASPVDDVGVLRDHLDERQVHSDLTFRLVDRTATFLNAGFPVNFDGRLSTTPGRFIQPTPVMMLCAATQAVAALETGQTDFLELNPGLTDWLDREFREILGADAHFLVPPPEEAW